MEKKTKKILLFGLLALSILVIAGSLTIVLIKDLKWLWFIIPSSFFALVWIVLGIIWLSNRQPKLPPTTKIDPNDAVKKIINMVKLDDDNGDNLENVKKIIWRLGDKKYEPTPILVVTAWGTEKKQKRAFLVNLNNPDKEISDLPPNPTDEKVWKDANFLADHPADLPMTEKVTESLKYGFPERTIERTGTPSSQKDREEKEKKEAEERGAS